MTDMTSAAGAAARAYRTGLIMPLAGQEEQAAGPSFEDLLGKVAGDAVETVRNGDRAVVAGLRGEISTQEVVEATRAMESALQVAISFRNKVVEAYTEVLRMSV